MHHQNDLDADDWGTAHLDRASLWSFLQYVVTAGEGARQGGETVRPLQTVTVAHYLSRKNDSMDRLTCCLTDALRFIGCHAATTIFTNNHQQSGVFHNSGLGPQLHFAASKVWGLNRQLGGGMAVFYGAAGLTWALGGWRLLVLLWAWPFVANCGYVSVVNWDWHAFTDPLDVSNYLGGCVVMRTVAGA